MRLNFGHVLGAVLASAGLAACGAANDGESPDMQEPIAKTEGQTLLTSLTIADGHRIEFYGYEGGGFGMVEISTRGAREQLNLGDHLKGLSPAEIYGRLAPAGAEVPASIRAVDERFKAAAQAPVVLSPPPESVAEAGTGPALYTDAEQTWFRNTFCTSSLNVLCFQGWDWAVSPWEQATWFRTAGYVNSGGSGTFTPYRWNGAAAWPLDVKYLNSNEVWQYVFTWPSASWWKSELFLDTSSQISLSVDVN